MGRTVNRMPTHVDVPNSKDIKQYFFNQYKWKGINDDKNFLAVDQETFIDANNVYVDSEGLLKSRPSLKIKTIEFVNGSTKYNLSNIVDVWTFEYVTVYQTFVNSIYYLVFVNKNVTDCIQAPLTYLDENNETKTYKNVKLIVANTKIFVFSEYSFNYYDMLENSYNDATKFIHIPVTNVIIDGQTSASKTVESPNLLTTSYITKYLYTSLENVRFDNLIGKNVTITLDDVSYEINFTRNSQMILVSKYTGASEYNFTTEDILGQNSSGIPCVCSSQANTLLLYSYSVDLDSNFVPAITWSIYFTVDGIKFEQLSLPAFGKVIGMPILSEDGNYCIVFISNGGYDANNPTQSDGPYIISLIGNDYQNWTNLLYNKSSLEYANLELNINEINTKGSSFNQSVVVNGNFKDDDLFAFVYGSNLSNTTGDPVYLDFYCIKYNGTSLTKTVIFKSSETKDVHFNNPSASNTINLTNMTDTVTETHAIDARTTEYRGYLESRVNDLTYNLSSGSDTCTITISNIIYHQNYYYKRSLSTGQIHPRPIYTNTSFLDNCYISFNITYNYTIYDSSDRQYNFTNTETCILSTNSPVTYDTNFERGDPSTVAIKSYNNSQKFYSIFRILIESKPRTPDIHNTNSSAGPMLDYYYQSLTIDTISDLNKSVSLNGTAIHINDKDYFASTSRFIPKLKSNFNASSQSIALEFIAFLQEYSNNPVTILYTIINNVGTVRKYIENSTSNIRSSIRDDCCIDNSDNYKFAYVYNNSLIVFDTTEHDYGQIDYNAVLKFDNSTFNLLTNYKLLVYNNVSNVYTELSLLFTAVPAGFFNDIFYIATENSIYVNKVTNGVLIVDELTTGKFNYFLPEHDALLSNYYFSKGNTLYISSPAVKININNDNDKSISETKIDFEWYLPEINKQEFDFDITNLHTISNTDVAIFFEHSVSYVNWDSDAQAYRYWKSKLQTGCKPGCDVLTTYDGKYVVFTSERGLVALTSQEFMATTEQAITYLSDTIYNMFQEYITDSKSTNKVKLFKQSYWIIAYKQDSKKMLVLDIRNNSWWVFTLLYNTTKLIKYHDNIDALLNHNMYDFDKSEVNYYDNDGAKHKIHWFIKSQKLHFNATNYYKHIVNMTFISVHDKTLLENATFNVSSLDCKLQINSYRKQLDGNIGNDNEYTVVEYDIESARTYVQRLNYSKVNEFQYLLSDNEETAISSRIPLSLNNITVKYKIGTQVR